MTRKHGKHKGLTGYKLHRKRLEYTNGESIRTIKYPLVNKDKNVISDFCENVRKDYEGQIGQFNASAFIEDRAAYSMLDVYIDFLRIGGIFHQSTLHLKGYLDGEESKESKEVKQLMQKRDKKFFNLIDFVAFNQKVLLSTGVRKKSSDEEIKNIFYGNQDRINKNLKKDRSEKKLKGKTGVFKYEGYIANRKDIEKYTKEILSGISKGGGETKGQSEQRKFWEERFGARFIPIDKKKEQGAVYFHPDIQVDKTCEPDKLIDRIRKIDADSIEMLLGIDGTYSPLFYAFNTFLSLLHKENDNFDLQEAKNAILNINKNLWKGKEGELEKRLQWLSRGVSELETKPYLANSWADYRTNFGGKLKSWVSNTDNQKKKIADLLFGYTNDKDKFINGHKQDLEKEKGELEKRIKELKDGAAEKELKMIFEEAIEINKGLEGIWCKDKNFSYKILEVYENLFADLRTHLNKYIQKKYPDFEEKELKKERNKYKSIFSEIPQLPSFPGGRKKEKMKKILESKSLLEHGVQGITELHKKLQGCNLKRVSDFKDKDGNIDHVLILKRFDTLCGMYNKEGVTQYAEDIIKKEVKEATGIDITKMKDEEVFSKYKRRGKWTEVKLSISIEEIYKKLPKLIKGLKMDFSKKNIHNIPEYLDAVELEKVRSGIINMFLEVEIRKNDLKKIFTKQHFPSLHTYLDLIEKNILDGSMLSTIMQRYVFSEIRGVLNVLSKKEFMERYVIQPIGINSKAPIVYDTSNHRWYISFGKLKNTAKKDEPTKWFRIKEKDITNEGGFKNIHEPESKNILGIQSSKYQLQFLKESSPYFSKCFSKKFDVKISEYSFIVEDTYKIDFSQNKPTIKRQDKKTHLYVSIPFKLSAKNRKSGPELKNNLDKRKKYLGIDVGEYGLAFSLIEPKTGKVLHSWFEYEPGIRTVRSTYKLNQAKQKVGTFTFANTKLARIRGDVAHKIRSRIHDIAVRYNAVPTYEFSISNFETGSSRLTALYKTVKTSDTSFDGSPAETAQREHTWGQGVYIGKHYSSYGTSYTCTKCWRCLYNICGDVGEYDYKRIENSNYIVLSVNGNKVYGYDKESSDSSGKLKNDEKKKIMQKAVKDFARPPIFNVERDKQDHETIKSLKINTDLLSKHPILSGDRWKKYGNSSDWERFYYQSGNSGVFVCPFKGCGHISDADVQASLVIGLRGWYKNKEKTVKQKKESNKKTKNKAASKDLAMLKELECYKSIGLKPIKMIVPRESWNDKIKNVGKKK